MRVMMQCIHETHRGNLILPCTEKELQIFCDSLEVSNTAKTEVNIGAVYNDAKMEALLSGKTVNLNELNYFMKRLDSFDEGEWNTFRAVAAGRKLSTLRDMIDLTFNTHCYSLVDDFSDLDRLGKNLYLGRMGSVSAKELSQFDGKAYVEKIMAENPAPLVTPYGLVYENGNQPQLVYNGRTFPAYWYEPNPITLSISKENDTEYLYLPVEKSELDKALQRLHAESLEEVSLGIEDHTLPENLANIVITEESGFADLNQFASMLKDIGEREVSSLSELAAFVKISTPEQLKTLTGCMFEFERFSGIHNAAQYGSYMICESGHFEYDENLVDYIDFGAYGRDKISRENGVFTDQGYLLYHGCNQEMHNILRQNLGMKIKEMQEPQELKLYMPLKGSTYYDENQYGQFYQTEHEMELFPEDLAEYADEIEEAMSEYEINSSEERGLMAYYGQSDSVNAKVKRYDLSVEIIDGKLMGVATLQLNAPLNDIELAKIKDTIEGQCSDGAGEGFEQQEIDMGGRDVYVHLWQSKGWSLKTASEMGIAEQSHEMQFGGM